METANLITMIGWAASGTGFTFMMTALGAASVFFFRKTISENVHRMALGLAAGIMIAASVWSLLIPAMEAAEEAGGAGWLPACGGFILGVAFLLLLDELLPHLHPGSKNPEVPSISSFFVIFCRYASQHPRRYERRFTFCRSRSNR